MSAFIETPGATLEGSEQMEHRHPDRDGYDRRLLNATRAMIRCRYYAYYTNAKKMKKGSTGRKYAASRLRQYRQEFVWAWNWMPEVRNWPAGMGNKNKGLGNYIKKVRAEMREEGLIPYPKIQPLTAPVANAGTEQSTCGGLPGAAPVDAGQLG